MVTMDGLTARCSSCRGLVLPRIHPLSRGVMCSRCLPGKDWGGELGLAAPQIPERKLRRVGAGPTFGDLVHAALTGRTFFTRAWLSAAIGGVLLEEGGELGLLLTKLEELGHIVQNPKGNGEYWMRPARWVSDRTELPGGKRAEFAVGARDAVFWTQTHMIRLCQPSAQIPSKIVRFSQTQEGWAEELGHDLPTFKNWILARAPLEPSEMSASRGRLSSSIVREKIDPQVGDVCAWDDEHGANYGYWSRGGVHPIPLGVARIMAVGFLPYVRKGARLAIPRSFQPPLPYRRVLTLCSGLLPDEIKDPFGQIWLVYESVDHDIFSLLRTKLPLRELTCTT
jgi:hypothetical protein